jgi:hypothetical protein
LVALNKKAIFIPTPGQTEQEYLAKYYLEKGYYYSMDQSHINFLNAFNESEKFSTPEFDKEENHLKDRVKGLLVRL